MRWTNRDFAAITVLALLLQGPRHPYEIHRMVVDTHKDFLTGLPRSIYHAVDRLVADDLIAVHSSDRDGARPERTIYAVTAEGRAELATRLRQLFGHVDADATVLHVAVSFIGCLPPRDAALSLQGRVATLQGRVATIDATLTGLHEAGRSRVLLLDLEWERARTTAELGWVRDLLSELWSGGLSWAAALDGPLFDGVNAIEKATSGDDDD